MVERRERCCRDWLAAVDIPSVNLAVGTGVKTVRIAPGLFGAVKSAVGTMHQRERGSAVTRKERDAHAYSHNERQSIDQHRVLHGVEDLVRYYLDGFSPRNVGQKKNEFVTAKA